MFNPDGLPVWADRHRLAGNIASHDHDFLEIALVTQGTAVHLSTAGEYDLGPGSAVIVPSSEWHGYAECVDLVVFDCFVAPELVDGALAFLDQHLPLLRMIRGGLSELTTPRIQLSRGELSRCIAELHHISDSRTPGERSVARTVGHLLVYLDILGYAWQRGTVPTAEPGRRPHPAAVGAAQLMDSDLSHAWSLGELAARLAVERTHLVRVFRQSVGLPPMAYLNHRRAQAASALLVRTDLPVAVIGARVGWHDPAYFARRFRSQFGMSPSAYRLRALSGDARSHEPAAVQAPLPVSGARYMPSADGQG